METSFECVPCLARQAAEAATICTKDNEERITILRQALRLLAEADLHQSPPALARQLHRMLREETGNADPYRGIRDEMNRLALGEMNRWRRMLRKAADPLDMVVRLSAAGNLLDSAAKSEAHHENLPKLFSTLKKRPLAGDPHLLFRLARQASRILLLADNAGEIVFDRLLVEMLPPGKVTVAVRGAPIINDALREDAETAGLARIATIISNGTDAPGTLLDECPAEFRKEFEKADLIISKGQGNYESLTHVRAPIFFIFTVKCPLIATRAGAPVGSMVARPSVSWQEAPEHDAAVPSVY